MHDTVQATSWQRPWTTGELWTLPRGGRRVTKANWPSSEVSAGITDQALNIRSASICEEAFGNLAVAVVA